MPTVLIDDGSFDDGWLDINDFSGGSGSAGINVLSIYFRIDGVDVNPSTINFEDNEGRSYTINQGGVIEEITVATTEEDDWLADVYLDLDSMYMQTYNSTSPFDIEVNRRFKLISANINGETYTEFEYGYL